MIWQSREEYAADPLYATADRLDRPMPNAQRSPVCPREVIVSFQHHDKTNILANRKNLVKE
jgi:hypothetical protein